jgi:hypothetical protein
MRPLEVVLALPHLMAFAVLLLPLARIAGRFQYLVAATLPGYSAAATGLGAALLVESLEAQFPDARSRSRP